MTEQDPPVPAETAIAALRDLTEAVAEVAGRLYDLPCTQSPEPADTRREVTSMANDKGNDNPAKGSPREGETADKILGRGSNPKNK